MTKILVREGGHVGREAGRLHLVVVAVHGCGLKAFKTRVGRVELEKLAVELEPSPAHSPRRQT
jgi:hypothetical protein